MAEKFIDLSLPLKPGMRGVNFKPAKQIDKDGWNALELCLYSHAGTHVDAPVHFGLHGTLDQVPLESFFCQAWVVDIKEISPGMEITTRHLGDIIDRLKPGEGLLLKTGWWKKHGTPEYRDALPRVSQELASWCAKKKVKMLAVEPPSVADVHNLKELRLVHRILLKANILIVEGIANTGKIMEEKVELIVLPLPIEKGDGAPARVIARPVKK
jgi:kynurenine formamidase